MAWIRQLPSGLWAATVRLPSGKRVTESDRLKGRVERWASDLESDIRRGDWIDPRAGEVTVGEWWARTKDSRHLERASRKRDQSHWTNHVAPRWAKVPIGSIMRPDVAGWVVGMERAGVGAATIQGSVGVLRGLLEVAVDARLIRDNPAKGVRLPRRNAPSIRILSVAEEEHLLAVVDQRYRLFVELLLHGLRWEEAAALDREHVDMRRQLVHVGPVLERDGTIRPYPKSKAGIRAVPVAEDVWPRLREHAMSVRPGGLLFTAPKGGPLHYSSWLRRVWHPAVKGLDEPLPTPHDCRHTYGTRLGEDRMPAHEIMALMGHASLSAAQRYLHAGEDRFDRARAAMRRVRQGHESAMSRDLATPLTRLT